MNGLAPTQAQHNIHEKRTNTHISYRPDGLQRDLLQLRFQLTHHSTAYHPTPYHTIPSGWGTTQARCSGCCQQHGHEKQTRHNLTKQTATGREKHKLDQTTRHNTDKLRAGCVACPEGLLSHKLTHALLKTNMFVDIF